MFAVNVDGVFHTIRAALPHFIHRKAGKILTVSSMWGQVGGSCEAAYSAAKAAVIGLTKALAKELGPSGITVNCVSPGVIQTDMNAHLDGETMAALAEETPWAPLARRRMWRRPCGTWPPTRPGLSPGRCSPPTAGWSSEALFTNCSYFRQRRPAPGRHCAFCRLTISPAAHIIVNNFIKEEDTMKKTRILSLAMTGALCLSLLAGCGGGDSGSSETPPPAPPRPRPRRTPVPPPPARPAAPLPSA